MTMAGFSKFPTIGLIQKLETAAFTLAVFCFPRPQRFACDGGQATRNSFLALKKLRARNGLYDGPGLGRNLFKGRTNPTKNFL